MSLIQVEWACDWAVRLDLTRKLRGALTEALSHHGPVSGRVPISILYALDFQISKRNGAARGTIGVCESSSIRRR